MELNHQFLMPGIVLFSLVKAIKLVLKQRPTSTIRENINSFGSSSVFLNTEFKHTKESIFLYLNNFVSVCSPLMMISRLQARSLFSNINNIGILVIFLMILLYLKAPYTVKIIT